MKKFKTTIGTTHEFEFLDTIIPNSGTTAFDQFNAGQTIHSFVMDNNVRTEIYIPFHAINYVHSTAESVENEPVQDANC